MLALLVKIAMRKPKNIMKSAENEKKRNYVGACLEQRRHFTPFLVSCEGLLGREAATFMQRLGKKQSEKWNRPYSNTISFIRTRFAITLVRAKQVY